MNIFTHKYYQTNFLNKRENNILTNLLILYIKREVAQKKEREKLQSIKKQLFVFLFCLYFINTKSILY